MTEILEIAQLGCIDLLERGKKLPKNNNTKFLTGITFTGIYLLFNIHA